MVATVILASGSASRRTLLSNAGVAIESVRPNVDEDAAKAAMRADDTRVSDQAMALAEMKGVRVSSARAGLVIAGDQMLALGGKGFDKPATRAAAQARLETLSGQTHTLETALVVCEDGAPVWRILTRPKLTMRPLSPAFLEDYLDRVGPAIHETVGGYQLEGLGSQLFTAVEGDYFSILGLPLLPLLDYLRTRGILAT